MKKYIKYKTETDGDLIVTVEEFKKEIDNNINNKRDNVEYHCEIIEMSEEEFKETRF